MYEQREDHASHAGHKKRHQPDGVHQTRGRQADDAVEDESIRGQSSRDGIHEFGSGGEVNIESQAAEPTKKTPQPTIPQLRAALKLMREKASVANDDVSVAELYDAANDLRELRESRTSWSSQELAIRREIDAALSEGDHGSIL